MANKRKESHHALDGVPVMSRRGSELITEIALMRESLPAHYTQVFITLYPKYKGMEKVIRDIVALRRLKSNPDLIADLKDFVKKHGRKD